MHDRWSLGVLIGLPIAGIALIILLAVIAYGLFLRFVDRDQDGFAIAGWASALTVGLVIGVGVVMFPWSTEYHQWKHHGGEIERISSRLVSSGSGDTRAVNQRYVVSFKGDPGQWSCDDTRCSLLNVGDTLDVSCKRHYQWSGTPGYDCNYVRSNLGIK